MTVINFPGTSQGRSPVGIFGLPAEDVDGHSVVTFPYTTSTGPFDCNRCGIEFDSGPTVVTEPTNRATYVCRTCANDDLTLRVWQAFVDIANRLDRLFEPVSDREHRQVLTDLLASHITWMASWRWDDAPISIHPADDDERDLDSPDAS